MECFTRGFVHTLQNISLGPSIVIKSQNNNTVRDYYSLPNSINIVSIQRQARTFKYNQ